MTQQQCGSPGHIQANLVIYQLNYRSLFVVEQPIDLNIPSPLFRKCPGGERPAIRTRCAGASYCERRDASVVRTRPENKPQAKRA
jgi:hypothetical protein